MATDSTSSIAGSYPQRFPLRLTCILKEGDITVAASGSAYSDIGDTGATYTFASPLTEGDIVALSDDTGNTYALTGGNPVVERAANTESLVFGKIVTLPDKMENNPSSSQSTWATMLSSGYYRVAMVEVWMGITKVEEAVVQSDGSNGVAIGVGTTLNLNIADCYANHDLRFITAAGNGTGVIPFHYMASGTAGDQATILVGITGPMYAVTGS
jgi:hypothetical protein